MLQFGYKLMSEEHGPSDLVANARLAEDAGFDFLSISDHFHPWLESQGHSPFVWSVLGAIAEATSRIAITTGLTCPIIRYHPAIIAQAAATIAVMSAGRFSLAVGAGERLNETVTGARWPAVIERHEMLAEAIDIFRALWSGEVHSHAGKHFSLNHARLFDPPPQAIPVLVGVSGERSIALAVQKGDGIMATEAKAELVEDFIREKGPAPCYGEVALAFAPSVDEGRALAHERFRFSALGWAVNSELPAVEGFEAATRYIRAEDLAGQIPAGPDVEPHVDAIRKYVEAGFTHIVLTGIGPDQSGFARFFEKELRPALGSVFDDRC